jgi:hypothetical protein
MADSMDNVMVLELVDKKEISSVDQWVSEKAANLVD